MVPFGNLKRLFAQRSTQSNKDSSSRSTQREILDILIFGLVALAIIFPFRYFIATPFIVNGSSMDPTFKHNDYLIVDRLSLRVSDPKRYDVVVFKYPFNPEKFFIKRVIGLPGERILVQNGRVTVFNSQHEDGLTIPPPYVDVTTEGAVDTTLGEDEFFVLGDNREASSDSRYWGALPKKYLVGEPALRLFPFSAADIRPGRDMKN